MSADVELVVCEDAEAAALDVARRLAAAAREGGDVALTGGSTPRRAYELAASLEPDWARVRIWWSDERCVAPEDERSNFRLAKESLLDRLDHAPAEVHRIRGELAPEEAAASYDAELRGVAFDLLLLGMGPDGHAASLFPRSPALDETERLAVAARPGLEPLVDRVTLTLPALRAARETVFLVTGEEKAGAVQRAFARPPTPETPSSLVRGERTIVVLDRLAARDLS